MKILKSSINNLFSALTHSRYLSYGRIDMGNYVQYYNIIPNNIVLELSTNNYFSISITAVASANFKIGPFNFDKTLNNATITLGGNIQLHPAEEGLKL